MTGKALKIKHLIIPLFTAIVLSGCGLMQTAPEAGLTVNQDKTIRSVIIEEFDEGLYSTQELESLIKDEVALYNSEKGNVRLTYEPPVTEEGYVTVVMDYLSAEDYAEFNNRRLHIESLEEALANEALNVSFKAVGEEAYVDLSDITEPGKYSVLITDEHGRVVCPGKIEYVSDGVIPEGKKQVTVFTLFCTKSFPTC